MVTVNGNMMWLNLKSEGGSAAVVDVMIDGHLANSLACQLRTRNLGHKHGIITDSNVYAYGADLYDAMKDEGIDAYLIPPFEAGEASKSLKTCEEIIDRLDELKFGRDSVLIGVGGGVVTDMTGVIAANYARGIPLVLYPTTTAAQADAAIGGKTGVNSRAAKNRFGRIYQPKLICIDVMTLITLPERAYREGFAETIKHGIIQDADFFKYLQDNVDLILKRDLETLVYIAKQNVRIKGTVVEQDPNERGLRQILNYGHTIGHALETQLEYKGLMHGEAVSIGMMAEARMAIMMNHFSNEELAELESLFKRFGLPTVIPAEITEESILEKALLDKKARAGRTRYSLPEHKGKMCDFNGAYASEVPKEYVIAALQQTR